MRVLPGMWELNCRAWAHPCNLFSNSEYAARCPSNEVHDALTNTMVTLEHHARTFFLLSRSSKASPPCFRDFTPGRPSFRRRFATGLETRRKKPYYVTSPIFYVNAGTCYLLCHRTILMGSFSSSCRPFVYPRLNGYSEEMANSTGRPPCNPAHGHRRAWHENSESGAESRT